MILTAIAAGERITDIAQSLGLASHASISRVMADDPEYIAAREAGAESKLDIRERELERADDNVTVARARDLLSHQRWRCEREFSARWADKSKGGVNVNIDRSQHLDLRGFSPEALALLKQHTQASLPVYDAAAAPDVVDGVVVEGGE
jgi:hypothetical protein